ncbi:cytochrome P450 [Bacillus lacus]|uniref:Cytochrome P450 n=1 Tax=Metabacillus lacus TaxID=1983721 RepID=A0A7X2LZX0_9BACI|nr:cytochrome P450 [Metabacillus lacus]MRX73881.1 cytochrome P450 [Metabacillus lacus]
MAEKRAIPVEEGLDHSIKLLGEGYQFILNRRKSFESNIFETRLLAQKAICLTGKEGAQLFYDNDKFKREGAAPGRVQKTLFGVGGVQGLDGEAHHHRKGMFMSIMSKEARAEVSKLTYQYWDRAAAEWEQKDSVILYEEAKKILTQVACDWVGVPLKEDEVEERAEQLGDMFESAAAVGPKHWKGRRSRTNAEEWMEELVEMVRREDVKVSKEKALYTFSMHRDLKGNLLEADVVAVELLNLLRPTVAISVYIAFTGLAVHQHADKAEAVTSGDPDKLRNFVQEVRRFYPFFPFTAALVKEDFEWNGYLFEKDTLTLLDLYGTCHHPEEWENPDLFQPERFETWDGSPFDFIPQGGGEFDIGHRCAGEWITVDIMQASLDYLVNKMMYDLPEQDLTFSFTQIPSLPESKIVMSDVKRV